eukprot:TRINITY_DN19565_c0_g1_i7.p2 TRINITY_DN19565_c0_g1~~TRINITY_DN19565_c0_g1_i7.p2  ORF type:complete len:136 (+),score=20.58 TRINITY_DN19565_c0_g1_i7:273-680(+)
MQGNRASDVKIILEGLAEWLSRIRAGSWGVWLQQRLQRLERGWEVGVRGARLTLDGSEEAEGETSPQVFEAWKLLKIVFLQYAPDLLGKRVVPDVFPELIASFENGKLQSIGKLQFDEAKSEVYFPLAVTRYTIS